MKSIQGIVEDFKSFGPKEGKFGEFYNNTYTINGNKYSVGFAKKNTPEFYDKLSKKEIPISIGSDVTVFFETNKTERGEFHNITTISLNDTKEEVASAEAERVLGKGAKPMVTASTKKITGFTSSTPIASNGARFGMIANNAVALAIARKKTALDDLRVAANDVLLLITELEAGKSLLPVTTEDTLNDEQSK